VGGLILGLFDRQAEQDVVAGHVGDEHLSEAEVADPVHAPGGLGQRGEHRVPAPWHTGSVVAARRRPPSSYRNARKGAELLRRS